MDSRDTITNQSFTLNDSSQSLPNAAQCSPIFVEYQLMKEFVLFQKQNISHVFIIPSYNSAFEWFGVMFIHNGLYAGNIIRFQTLISSSYPNCDVPKIYFDPIPVHPYIDQTTGELNTKSKFSKWNSTSNFIFEVISYAKACFEICETSGQQLDFNIKDLKEKINKQMANFNELVIKKTVDDKNYINFTEPENMSLVERLKNNLLKGKVSYETDCGKNSSYNPSFREYGNTSISGLSWTKRFIFN